VAPPVWRRGVVVTVSFGPTLRHAVMVMAGPLQVDIASISVSGVFGRAGPSGGVGERYSSARRPGVDSSDEVCGSYSCIAAVLHE
jgi:hypothetical protein